MVCSKNKLTLNYSILKKTENLIYIKIQKKIITLFHEKLLSSLNTLKKFLIYKFDNFRINLKMDVCQVKNLNDSELFDLLKFYKINCGPVQDTTRSVYQRKLINHLKHIKVPAAFIAKQTKVDSLNLSPRPIGTQTVPEAAVTDPRPQLIMRTPEPILKLPISTQTVPEVAVTDPRPQRIMRTPEPILKFSPQPMHRPLTNNFENQPQFRYQKYHHQPPQDNYHSPPRK